MFGMLSRILTSVFGEIGRKAEVTGYVAAFSFHCALVAESFCMNEAVLRDILVRGNGYDVFRRKPLEYFRVFAVRKSDFDLTHLDSAVFYDFCELLPAFFV